MIEAKQVGIVYHFTTIDAIKKLTNEKLMKQYGCDIFTFASKNKHFSTTRDYQLTRNPLNGFKEDRYPIRITLDGNKLSEKYKIKPINGLSNNDNDLFGTDKNNLRVQHKSEREEIICPLKSDKYFSLKDYILEIQIYKNNNEEYETIYNELKTIFDRLGLNIKIEPVRKWKPYNEDYSIETEIIKENYLMGYEFMNESTGTYVARKVKNPEYLYNFFKEQGVDVVSKEELHCTIAYSRKEFTPEIDNKDIVIKPEQLLSIEPLGDDGAIVLKFDSNDMQERFDKCIEKGATFDYESYTPHITLTYNGLNTKFKKSELPKFDIILGDEYFEELDLDWKDKIVESSNTMEIIYKDYLDFLKKESGINTNIKLKLLKSKKNNKYFGDVDLNQLKKDKYVITVESGSVDTTLKYITHEFKHILQYLNGDLKFDDENIIFKNVSISIKDYNNITDYNEYTKVPFEADAIKFSEIMSKKYKSNEYLGKLKGTNDSMDFVLSMILENYDIINTLKEDLKIKENKMEEILEKFDKEKLEALVEYAKDLGIDEVTEEILEQFEESINEIVKLSDVEDILGKGNPYGKYTKFELKDGSYVLLHPSNGLEYRAKDDSLLPHNWKTAKAMKKELVMGGMIKESIEEASKEGEKVLTKLKADLRKAGFTSWTYEGDYETLIITFKDNATALKAFRKYKEEIGFISSEATCENGKIVLELNDEVNEDIIEACKNKLMEDEDYKTFFNKKLEKYKVESPEELSDEDKKTFYDEVDAEWKGEDEEPEVNESLESSFLKLKEDDKAGFISDIKDLFMSELSKNETYVKMSSEMESYK